MLINTDHAPLEYREEAFNGVAVDVAPRIFFAAVIDRTVAEKLLADAPIVPGLIGVEVAITRSGFEGAGDFIHT